MGRAIVVYDKEVLITVDEDNLKQMTALQLMEIIHQARIITETGKSNFFADVTTGPNPEPVWLNKEEK